MHVRLEEAAEGLGEASDAGRDGRPRGAGREGPRPTPPRTVVALGLCMRHVTLEPDAPAPGAMGGGEGGPDEPEAAFPRRARWVGGKCREMEDDVLRSGGEWAGVSLAAGGLWWPWSDASRGSGAAPAFGSPRGLAGVVASRVRGTACCVSPFAPFPPPGVMPRILRVSPEVTRSCMRGGFPGGGRGAVAQGSIKLQCIEKCIQKQCFDSCTAVARTLLGALRVSPGAEPPGFRGWGESGGRA